MKQQLATLRPNQYTSNNTIAKSQKIITTSNFHLKTEQQEEEHRSPEQKVEFRQTSWRKPRMPYNKFPDGFPMQHARKSTGKKITEEDIDKMVRHYQHKEVKKILQPIPLKVEETARQQQSDNPFATYQKYLKIKSKFSQGLQLPEREKSLNKYKALSTRVQHEMRVNDCITLEVIKRGHNTGTIKKMLHVPTLQLVTVREEPISNKESRNAIKEWVHFWQSKLNREGSPRFLKVHAMAFNYPQGAYIPQGSLLDLLHTVLTLPESVIKEIFREVVYSLQQFYQLTDRQYGGLSPSQILLGAKGIQLGMGLYYHFVNTSSSSIYHIKTPQKTNIFQMNTTQRNFMKSSITQPANLETERSLDVFKLGLIVLECAVGTFQNFEQSAILHEILRSVFSEQGQKQVELDNVCCLVHCETYLLEWAVIEDKAKQVDLTRLVPYFKFLKERFSIHFLSFLCESLKLSHTRRASLKDLVNHSFLHFEGKDNITVDLTLDDLIGISGEPDSVVESIKEERMEKFIGHVLQVLSSCGREEVMGLLKGSRDKILGLNKYIGLHYMGLGQKLYDAMVGLVKSMRA